MNSINCKKRSVAVLKGFVFGVEWYKHADKISDLIEKLKPFSAIAWDGDLYKTNSFTFVLQLVMNRYPNKMYIAFKKEKGLKKLKPNYFEYNTGVPSVGFSHKITTVKMHSNMKWNDMGIAAIQYLQRKFNKVHIFFLGQGYVAKQEEKKIMQAQMIFPNVEITKIKNINRKVSSFNKVRFKSQLTNEQKKRNLNRTLCARSASYKKYSPTSLRKQSVYFGPKADSLVSRFSRV